VDCQGGWNSAIKFAKPGGKEESMLKLITSIDPSTWAWKKQLASSR
jgi:lipid A disaccharide synthetase